MESLLDNQLETERHLHEERAFPDPFDQLVVGRGLRRQWGSGAGATTALDGVDLAVRRGEMLAIVGPSGSGKSTLAAILAGLDQPDSGAVSIDGVRIDRLGSEKLARWRARNVGIVLQDPHLMGVLTAEENVALALRIGGVRRGRSQASREALAAVGLRGLERRHPSQLSGGERQRVGIARAVASRPGFVVADEPTGALDRASGRAVFELLRELSGTGTTVVLVTHDLELAAQADRTIELVDGRINEEVLR